MRVGTLVWSLVALLAPTFHVAEAYPTSGSPQYNSLGRHGGIATEVAECSEIGVELLTQGGSAVDAIIAGSLCVGVIAAYHSGIGGGGFGLVRSVGGDGKVSYDMVDFRETAPGASNLWMYVNSTDPTASTIGGLAVGVPGELRGWELLHQKYGKLPWPKLFEGAIKLARCGFTVNQDLAAALNNDTYPFLTTDPLWAEVYAPNGILLQQGDTAYRKRYANTLEIIAQQGADAFYTGSIAENIVSTASSNGGIITLDDLENYSALTRTPVNITYRGNRIFSTVAPSSGAVVLSALKVFEAWPATAKVDDPAYDIVAHRLIEATRFGYGQRTWYGDPAYTANVSSLEREFLGAPEVEKVRTLINDSTTYPAPYYNPSNYIVLDDHGTSHLAAADQWGTVVSLTTTINLYWGSNLMTPDGIILNDEMDDFSSPGLTNAFGFAPSPANFIYPGKRPQSSIASSIAEDLETGEFKIATGAAGGSRIITATLQNLHYTLDQGLTPNASVHTSRWHDQLTNVTYFELPAPADGLPGFDNGTVSFLASLNYNVTYEGITGSTSHIVGKINGTFHAFSDPRKPAGRGYAY
ncbi:gamma-glutamyltranspeptidase [Thelephora terrestris]|uniref:Glutathione hydrolase n=1 Tax=Thelephora terrestris TaxID=56493 RepID=A0A9P6L131_9AGAM|nr:gamma-glutamyltranspeptidase [Thelephora terrestris]